MNANGATACRVTGMRHDSQGTVATPSVPTGWIVSPAFDLAFFANIYWIPALVPAWLSADGEPYFQFWMAYFLATPHRWLTLLLAVAD